MESEKELLDAVRFELLDAVRFAHFGSVTVRAAEVFSCLLHLSVRPSLDNFSQLSPTVDKWFEDWCLGTVVSAANPFIPGMTLSVLLSKRAEVAPEGEKRKLVLLQERLRGLLLEILERLPQRVRGFRGGAGECFAMFEPEGVAPNPKYLPGPLSVALQHLEEFCAAPLVMDFLSFVFKKGLPDMRDVHNLRGNMLELGYLADEDFVLKETFLNDPRGGTDGENRRTNILQQAFRDFNMFLQGTGTVNASDTLLPGAQFIAAGVVAKPSVYYGVPAMRMALDFLVYVGMLAWFCAFVLLHDEGALAWEEMVFGVYLAVSSPTERLPCTTS